MSLNIAWPTEEGTKNAKVALPIGGIVPLRAAVKRCLGAELPSQSFTLTDTLKDITNDEDVAQLPDGATLVVTNLKDGQLAAPARERISFQPHPKTLTMAGDYEYFAAQGRHPFVYALAEFIDNSLRATRNNAPNPRNITISLLTTGAGAAKKGLVCIQDNGCGMTKLELNDWAVMNLSMEERGAAPQEIEAEGRGRAPTAGAGRFLNGDISFFGVGSKNAAFFMGSSVKIATRKAGERYIHELSLDAADLEARYRNNEAVYEEEMVHRNPGDESTLSKMEMPFNSAANWVREELVQYEGQNEAFTRVIIGDLKPDILQQLADDAGGAQICRELAHVYHYYLHGVDGNTVREEGVPSPTVLPNGDPFPNIMLRHATDSRVLWERKLIEVDDDLETRMLRAHKDKFTFSLEVPEKGTVDGVLYYFPYENDRETVPLEEGPSWVTAAAGLNARAIGAGVTQAVNGRTQAAVTQFGVGGDRATTQHFAAATAAANGAGGSRDISQDDLSDDEGAGGLPHRTSLFEAFWQGRLIPSAHIDSLPFLDALRQKRTAASKDALPDEVFRRLRGTLFFGPGFKVTRNKLLFRDNLPEVLSTAVPGDRNIEKRFKDWLSRCHSTLDKSFRFSTLAASREQAALRARLGEGITAFERVSDGNRTINSGDVVRLAAKPAVVGRVVYFTVPQAVRDDGAYSNGRVHVEPLPQGIYGNGSAKEFSLRRLDTVLNEKETEEHCSKEMSKLPMSLRVEPMRLATGQAVEMVAGDEVPETSIAVLNGGGNKLTRAFYNGEKQALMVTQKLWRLPHEGATLPSSDESTVGAVTEGENGEKENGESEAAERPVKRARKGRKGKKQQEEENADAAADAARVAESSSLAELVVSVDNKTPYKDSFVFSRISEGLKRAGHYVLEYYLTPAVQGQPLLRCTVPLVVGPAAATCLKVAGEGVAAVASRAIVLGETVPPFTLLLSDEYGNEVPMPSAADAAIKVQAMVLHSDGETYEKCKGLQVAGDMEPGETSVTLRELRFVGSKKAAAAGIGLPLFMKQAEEMGSGAAAAGGQRGSSQNEISAVTVHACFSLAGSSMEPEYVEMQLHPGAPKALQLLPGGFWEQEGSSANVDSGAELPEFTVRAVDACGNPTAPTEKLQFSLVVDSEAIVGCPHTFSFDAAGVATVSGLHAATRRSGASPVTLSVQSTAASESLKAAVELAQPTKDLSLTLEVLPSALPAYAQITVNGEPLPMEERPDDDGAMVPTAILNGVEAGVTQGNIRLVFLDESGAPAALRVKGKLTVSWHPGSKKTTWEGTPIKLPALTAPNLVSEPSLGFLRFTADGGNPLTIDCFIELTAIPGPPVNWSVTLVDQVNSQSPEQQGFIVCGQPFALEIEALDNYTNRCPGGAAALLPEPEITLESTIPLEYNADEWERSWVAHGNEEVYNVLMTVSGHPGEVKVKVRDSAAHDKSSLLNEDCLTVDLRAGPPAALAFDSAASIDCGTRAVLGNVEVFLRDAAGYPTKSTETFEITLAASALAADGSGRAAKVVANNANKAKLTKGKSSAIFKGVTITAEAAGTYALRVQSASRKVALQEGVLQLVMAPISAVTGLQVVVPSELSEGGQVGVSNHLLVSAETENGEMLPEDAAVAGLTLKVTPPGGNRNDIIVCTLPAAEEGGSLPIENGCYSFALADLTLAGVWTAAAEYTETRADVRAAVGKNANIRSSAVQFTVLSGPPVTATVEAPQLPDRATVTNASAAKSRLLVRNAAAQVQDAYGNVAEAEGVQLRFRLRAAVNVSMPQGSVIPTLEAEEGLDPKHLDDRGRAYFGKLSIVEGSGAAPAGPIDLELVCEALGLYPSSDVELEMDEEGWTVCWKCCVLFSDNAAQFGAVEKLNEQRANLLERREEIQSRVNSAQQALSVAEKQGKRAAQAADALQKRVAGDLPTTVKAAERQLKKLEKSAEAAGGEPEETRRPPRWGPLKAASTASIDMSLRLNTGGLIGVLAQLITINDDRLAMMASATLRPLLGVIVVEDNNSRSKLAAALTAKNYPVPDMLPLTQINVYRGSATAEIPGFTAAGELAKALTRSACAGTDRPLCLPLPHQKANRDASSTVIWPEGCLGYLCNLVRPVHSGHRATIVYGLLSGTLVFETLDHATAYREYVSQTLKIPFGNEMVCLDGNRVTGRGIISGSNFRPPPLDTADFVIGSGEGAIGSGPAEKIQDLQSWIEVLKEMEDAEASVAAAQREVDAAEKACRPELDGVEGELSEIEAQIAQLQTSPGGGNGGNASHQKQQKSGKKSSRKRQHDEEEEEVAVEVAEEEEPGEPKARSKRRR